MGRYSVKRKFRSIKIVECLQCKKEIKVVSLNQKYCKECSYQRTLACNRKGRKNDEWRIKWGLYNKKWREENREKYNRTKRKWDAKQKWITLTHYGGNPPKCQCCKETIYEFLTIDHISGRTKKDNYLGKTMYTYLKKNNFPKGYQVLCMNCNFAKGVFGKCPHKNKEVKCVQ